MRRSSALAQPGVVLLTALTCCRVSPESADGERLTHDLLLDPKARFALFYASQDMPARAIEAGERVLASHPGDADTCLGLAYALTKQGTALERRIDLLRKASEAQPESVVSAFMLFRDLMQARAFEEAASVLPRWGRRVPECPLVQRAEKLLRARSQHPAPSVGDARPNDALSSTERAQRHMHRALFFLAVRPKESQTAQRRGGSKDAPPAFDYAGHALTDALMSTASHSPWIPGSSSQYPRCPCC